MKNLWKMAVLALVMPFAFSACSGDDEEYDRPDTPIINPTPEPEDTTTNTPTPTVEYFTSTNPYVNQFCYEEMSFYYLWWNEQSVQAVANAWNLDADPVQKVKSVRYEEDRWTAAIEDIKVQTDPEATVSYTFGYDFAPGWADVAQTHVWCIVSVVYPGSPAEKAGLKRGSVITKMDGRDIKNVNDDYNTLLGTSSLKITFADSLADIANQKEVTMTGSTSGFDQVLYEKVFDCGGKKVGYVYFGEFTFDCIDRLIEVAKKFKSQQVTELILDLRYNGGGFVLTEEILASLLAPEANVKNKELLSVMVYNNSEYGQYLQKHYGDDYNKTYFSNHFEKWEYANKEWGPYDTSDANIGLNKIYALVTGSTASASESILVELMPYLDIEVIGVNTYGKHCSGVMIEAEDFFQSYEDYVAELKKKDTKAYEETMEQFWKYFSGWKDYVGNWGLYVMINTYADKNGNNPCRPNGIVPDLELKEDPIEPYQLGDDREILLRAALTKAGYTNFTPKEETAASRAASRDFIKLDKPKNLNSMHGKRIYMKKDDFRPTPLMLKRK